VRRSLVELDDPFVQIEVIEPVPTVNTPTGIELVFDDECDEPTKVYPEGMFEALRLEACAHSHKTRQDMKAIKL
jgi:hypothetical protein